MLFSVSCGLESGHYKLMKLEKDFRIISFRCCQLKCFWDPRGKKKSETLFKTKHNWRAWLPLAPVINTESPTFVEREQNHTIHVFDTIPVQTKFRCQTPTSSPWFHHFSICREKSRLGEIKTFSQSVSLN